MSPSEAAAALIDAVLARHAAGRDVGTGPFAIASQSDDRILLQRRRPEPRRIQEIELVSHATPRDAFAAALRGDVNAIVLTSDAHVELLDGVRTLKVIRHAGIHSVVALFNAARLGNDERRALARGLGLAELAKAFGPLCGAPPTERGAQVIGPGRALEILAFDELQGFGAASLALRRALGSRAGRIVPATAEEVLRRASDHDFDVLLITLQTWPVEIALERWTTGSALNWVGYSNPAFDEAFRASDYARAQAELVADPPAAFICDLERTAAVDSRLSDAELGDYDFFDSLDTWQVAP